MKRDLWLIFIFMPCFSGYEAFQEEAAVCAICLTQPYWLHFVVCYSYYYTNQVRRAHTTVFNYILYFGKIHGGSAVSTEWRYLTAVVPTPYLTCMDLWQMIRTTSASGEKCCRGRRSRLSLRHGRNWDTGSRLCLCRKYKTNWHISNVQMLESIVCTCVFKILDFFIQSDLYGQTFWRKPDSTAMLKGTVMIGTDCN